MATVSRNSILALALIGSLSIGVGITFFDAARPRPAAAAGMEERKALVEKLRLTDLCLFTEARYTRHPSQADLHSAAQDHPLALEHFPTGSLIVPPAGIAHAYEKLDRKAEVPD
jgi:hypothetical protein